jgi:Spy/CpxP family protein refolding chaperone
MTKAKLILIIAFVVTLAAGVALGYTVRSLTHRTPRAVVIGATSPHSHFPDLQLTAKQKAKLDEIWSAVRHNSREIQSEQRKAYQKQRDEAVRAILTEEQKVKYDEMLKEYASKMAELGKAREKAFQEDVEKTKRILNAEQRKQYEEWLKSWHEERRTGGAPVEPKVSPPPTQTEEHTAAGSGT